MSKKWARQDSNLGPAGYEPAALTKLSYGPSMSANRNINTYPQEIHAMW